MNNMLDHLLEVDVLECVVHPKKLWVEGIMISFQWKLYGSTMNQCKVNVPKFKMLRIY